MKAVLRVWWTFFTTVALQRVLCVVGGALLGLGIIHWLLSGESASFGLGYVAFVALVGTPALFTTPAMLRWLSAPRMHQLLPHFRRRMLMAASLLLGALLAAVFVFVLAMIFGSARPTPFSMTVMVLSYPIAFLVALFLVLFLAFGNWRWFLLLPLAMLASNEDRLRAVLATPPAWLWAVLALGAWAVFAAWYLRVPQVRGVMLGPQPRSGVDATRPVPRNIAIRVLLGSTAGNTERQITPRNALLVLAVLVAFMTLITNVLRSASLTSFLWPLMLMVMVGAPSVAVVRQSRLLWLRIPGARDAVRRAIEQVLWRSLAVVGGFLVVVAAIAASPLVGQGAAEVALGFALLAGAAIYATYVALAAVPSRATYLWAYGSMGLLLFALNVLSSLSPTAWSLETRAIAAVETAGSLKTVAIVTAIELAGAALLRILAVRRWRTLDWFRFKPLSSSAGVRDSP
jgi:hypothetical protein